MASNACKEYGLVANALRRVKVITNNIPRGHLTVVLPINRSTSAESNYGGKTDVKMFNQPISRLVCLACYPVRGFIDVSWRVISRLD